MLDKILHRDLIRVGADAREFRRMYSLPTLADQQLIEAGLPTAAEQRRLDELRQQQPLQGTWSKRTKTLIGVTAGAGVLGLLWAAYVAAKK